MTNYEYEFIDAMNVISFQINENAKAKGFWDKENADQDDGTKIMLMVTELGEAYEGYRLGNPPSDKIPEFNSIEEELADCVIRIMDYCTHKDYSLAEAILAKCEYNKNRPYLHGGKKA